MTSKEERKELMEEMQFGMLVMSTLEDLITHQKAITRRSVNNRCGCTG